MMADRFDDLIKSTLENDEVDCPSSDWHEFSSLLDAENGVSNQEFDRVLKHKIEDHDVPLNKLHWYALLDRLELVEMSHQNVFSLKIAELCFLILLLFSFGRYFPIDHSSSDELPTHIALNQDNQEDILDEKNYIPSVESSNTSEEWYEKPLKKERIQSSEELVINAERDLELTPVLAETTPLANEQRTNAQEHISSLNSEPKLIPYERTKVAINDVIKDFNAETKSSNSRWLRGYASADINIINSPFDFVFFKNPRKTGALGYSFGAAHTWLGSSGNEFELGASFTKKSYDPELVEYIGSPDLSLYEYSFDRNEINAISLNIAYRKYFLEKGAWSGFVSTGIDMNMIVLTEYLIEDTHKSGLARSERFLEKNSRLANKEFNEGLLQGGGMGANLYLTANIGLGMGYQLREDFGLFAQLKYGHHMLSNKIGPNNDKINSYSMGVGFKFKI